MIQLEFGLLIPYLQLHIYLKKSAKTSTLGRILKGKISLDNICTCFLAETPQVMAAWSLGAEKAFDMREWLFSNNFNFIPLFTWVRVLYAYLFEAVKTSGVISSYFHWTKARDGKVCFLLCCPSGSKVLMAVIWIAKQNSDLCI